jgi:SPP1 gp7 family putative phage head morphogenesis protein
VFARRFQDALGRWFSAIDAEYLRVLRFFWIEKGIPVKKVGLADLIENEFDWDEIEDEGEAIIVEVESTVSRDAIIAIIVLAALQLYYEDARPAAFPRSQQRSIDYALRVAEARAGALVTGITETMRQNIRNAIVVAIENNYSMDMLARMLRPGLPALPSSVNRINRQFADMLKQGVDPARAMMWAQREMQKATIYRAKMIARTESSYALNNGAILMYREAGIKQVEYVAQATACDICAPYDGHVFDINDSYGLIPQHPRCVCAWWPVN